MKNVKIISINILVTIVIVAVWLLFFEKKIWKSLTAFEQKNYNLNIPKEQTWNNFELNTFQDLITSNIENASKSVVSIVTSKNVKFYFENPFDFGPWSLQQDNTETWWWSGIIWSKDGYIITSKHVVEDKNAEYTIVTQDEKTYKVDKVWLDPKLDIAVLKIVDENWNIPNYLEPAKFISIHQKNRIWQFVFAIWNISSQYQNSVTMWVLSAKNRQFVTDNSNLYIWLYQTDTSMSPWNSGWPLLNINWEVIAINTAIVSFDKWIWFSLPISQEFVDQTIASIQQNGKIIRPEIWFGYTDITTKNKAGLKIDLENWIYVKNVSSGSVSQLAWILPGDIITKINNNLINNDLPFLYQVYTFKSWDELDFTILRNWDKKNISVVLK